MNKTIHVSAIVLAILILTVGCKGRRAAHGLRMKVQTQSLLTAPFKSIPERPQLPEVNIWTNSVKSAVILLIRSMAVDVALI